MMPQIFRGQGGAILPMSATGSKLSKVEFEDEEEDEDEFQFVFPASPQLLKEGLCCSERRPRFSRRELAKSVARYAEDDGDFVLVVQAALRPTA
jgi:hypothetical protein